MKSPLDTIALVLIIVGALNWGLWGVLQFDLVAALFGGNTSILSRIIYTLVGLAGIYSLTFFGKGLKTAASELRS